MDKTTKKNSKEEIVPIRRSIHVVYLSCPHCGEEMDDVRLCPECGEPMKVIDVVEKFGDDADRFLERAKKRLEKSTKENKQENNEEDDDFVAIDKEEPNIILMGGDDTIDEEMYQMIQDKRHIGNTITGATDKMEMTFVDNVVGLFKKK